MPFSEEKDKVRPGRTPRTVTITIRATPSERDLLVTKARARKSTLARFIRETAIFAGEPRSVVTPEDRLALSRIGNNLNQLARAVNSGQVIGDGEVLAVVAACCQLLDDIAGR